MPELDLAPMPTFPSRVLQPCTEACGGFRAFAHDGWSDYGVCRNPRSPMRGFPVQLGRECRFYLASPLPETMPAKDDAG